MTPAPDAPALTDLALPETALGVRTDDYVPWLAGAAATLRARLWYIILVAALFLLAAVVWLRTTDYTYTAELRIAPAPSAGRETGSLGALTSLATLTGATLESIPVTPFRLYLEGVYTREVAIRLAQDKKLMHHVFAAEWNPVTKNWQEPRGAGRALKRSINSLLGIPIPAWSPPDAARLQGWINANLVVNQSPKTPIVTLSIASTDRAFAQRFLVSMHTTVDAWLRQRTLDRTRNNIEYLTRRLPGVTLAEHRQALFVTLSDQQQRAMAANNPAPYAAETFGPPTASARPTSPRQLPVMMLAVILGTILGVVGALLVPRRRA